MSMTLRAAALAAAPALLFATGAQAHAHLVKATPAENAAVAAPQAIHLEFNEKLEPKFSGLTVTRADGAAVAVSSKAAGKAIHATVKAPLAPGAYNVQWRALSADGHKMTGQYRFTVR